MLKPIAIATAISGTLDILFAMILTVLFGREIGTMAIGYAALIILLSRSGGAAVARFTAVGRAAFTNYLGSSILGTAIFYGLKLYGTLDRVHVTLFVPLFWMLMLLWSKPWLDRFAYGPFEWAWRSLARWKVQPMRKRLPPVAAEA